MVMNEPPIRPLSSELTLQQIEAFLVLCDELHFGRASERLLISQPRLSRLIRELEQRIGAPLFERTNRRVEITDVGERFRNEVRPAHRQLTHAIDTARSVARDSEQTFRVGFHTTTAGPILTDVLRGFGSTTLVEVPMHGFLDAIRRHEVDVVSTWRFDAGDDIEMGPTFETAERRLAVSTSHPWAERMSVSIEEVVEVPLTYAPPTFPPALMDVLTPPATPTGKQLRRVVLCNSFLEAMECVAENRAAHMTVDSIRQVVAAERIALIPINGLPPMERVFAWHKSNMDPRITKLMAAL